MHSTAQHSTAQHSTAQHSTAQHSTAQHSISTSAVGVPTALVSGTSAGKFAGTLSTCEHSLAGSSMCCVNICCCSCCLTTLDYCANPVCITYPAAQTLMHKMLLSCTTNGLLHTHVCAKHVGMRGFLLSSSLQEALSSTVLSLRPHGTA